jgi:methylmalonyl-CoA/ethylmalonyl-CoA epimerase
MDDYSGIGLAGSSTRLHHVGFAFPNLDAGTPTFAELLGLPHVADDAGPGVAYRFFDAGECFIQVLCSTGGNKSLEAIVERQGGGVHHLAFCVDDVDAALAAAAARGATLIDQVKRPGSRGTNVGFCNPNWPGGTVIEFVEDANFGR